MIKRILIFSAFSAFTMISGTNGVDIELTGKLHNTGAVSDKGEYNTKPQGSTTISMKDIGSESEQTTHATIGMGTITIGGKELGDDDPALAGLNRDVDNAQEITKDLVTGALDGSVTIDNRLLTESSAVDINPIHKINLNTFFMILLYDLYN